MIVSRFFQPNNSLSLLCDDKTQLINRYQHNIQTDKSSSIKTLPVLSAYKLIASTILNLKYHMWFLISVTSNRLRYFAKLEKKCYVVWRNWSLTVLVNMFVTKIIRQNYKQIHPTVNRYLSLLSFDVRNTLYTEMS